MNKNTELLFKFIKEKSEIKDFFCDYFELRDNMELSDEELSIAIKELKKENKIIAKEGEYLIVEDIKKK